MSSHGQELLEFSERSRSRDNGGTSADLYQSCGAKCSSSCPCTWMFDDVWTWLNSPASNAHTPNATVEPTPP